MKTVYAFIMMMSVSALSIGQDFTSNSTSGDWQDSNDWLASNGPNDLFVPLVGLVPWTENNTESLISAGDTMVMNGDLTIGTNSTVTVEGVLQITGGLVSGSNATINVGANGHFDIDGSAALGGLLGGLTMDIASGGKFDVGGSMVVNTTDSDVNIDGEVNIAGAFGGGPIVPPFVHDNENWDGNGFINVLGNAACGGVWPRVPDPMGGDPTKCFDINNPLPVELLSFEAKELEGEYAVVVNWTTASEIDNDFFEIQRGLDLESFETIGVIDGNGTTKEQIDYEFIDNYPVDGISYYRLKQVDYDGTEFYHDIDYVNLDLPTTVYNGVGIYPNPFTETQYAYLDEDQEVYTVQLINMVGDEFPVSYDQERTRLDITYEVLESGLYVLNISTSDGLLQLKVIRD